ncbi:hypothetical protein [Sphingomonas xinjiangensis]|uniref:Uncharacterized protein n=1 Tax=Sphingomonas xinjiangensis TaxID=643568 RepID=A0A840YPF0_9SPHN|nr:hypothetical protein [Sphingomonas xinjiangensis]MBB5709323.1 hypothetical protein [Sphingomonas xinjiangensis]
MLKPYSTKRPRPVPPEFEQNFIAGGWARVNQMYGKNPALRYFRVSGPERLSLMRKAHVRRKGK